VARRVEIQLIVNFLAAILEELIMRFPVSILSFVLACVAGAGLVYLRTFAVEWYMPAFTGEETALMVGHRVRNIYWTDRFAGSKCPENGGACAVIKTGERGSVIRVEEVSPNRYFFVVRWDEPSQGEPMVSYFGRMSRRVFLEME
jgi:hypothetical protein